MKKSIQVLLASILLVPRLLAPAFAEVPGALSTAAEWEDLFLTSEMRGLKRELLGNESISPVSPLSLSGRAISTLRFQAVVKRPNIAAATILHFPLPGTAASSLENGTLVYKDVGPLLKSLLNSISGPTVIEFETARYEFLAPPTASNEPALWIKDRSDLLLKGQKASNGQKTEFLFKNPFSDGVRITSSQRVELSDIDIDFDYTQSVPNMNPSGVAGSPSGLPLGETHLIGQSCGNGYLASSELAPSEAGAIKTLVSFGERSEANGQKIYSYVNPNNFFHRFLVLQSNQGGVDRPLLSVDTAEARAACSGFSGRNLFFASVLKTSGNDFPRGYRMVLLRTRNAVFTRRDGSTSEIPLGNAVYAQGPGAGDITLSRLRLFGFPHMGALFKAVDGAQVIDSQIRARTEIGRMYSGRADALHFTGTNDVIVARNLISQQGDDGLNIHGNDLQALFFFPNPLGPDDLGYSPQGFDFELQLTGEVASLQVGDTLALLTKTNSPLHTLRVTRIGEKREHLLGGVSKSVVPIAVDFGRRVAALSPSEQRSYKDQLLKKLLLAQGKKTELANLFNLSRAGSRYVVEDNIFSDNAGRGMLLQSPNGLVQRNIVNNTAGAGILVTAENAVFIDGPGAMNLALLKNQLHANGFKVNRDQTRNAAISVGSEDDDPSLLLQPGFPQYLLNFPMTARVLIQGNQLGLSGQAGIFISRARGVEVSANALLGPFNRTGRVSESLGSYQVAFPPAPAQQSLGIRNSKNWFSFP